jgi:putative endonuclease
MNYCTYILRSQVNGKFYCGISNGIEKRLKEHNAGKCCSTKSGIPWELVFLSEFENRKEAHDLEIKSKVAVLRGIMKS